MRGPLPPVFVSQTAETWSAHLRHRTGEPGCRCIVVSVCLRVSRWDAGGVWGICFLAVVVAIRAWWFFLWPCLYISQYPSMFVCLPGGFEGHGIVLKVGVEIPPWQWLCETGGGGGGRLGVWVAGCGHKSVLLRGGFSRERESRVVCRGGRAPGPSLLAQARPGPGAT